MIDRNKQYRTRDGREVRIYAVDGGTEYPVHGAEWTGVSWRIKSWMADGRLTNQGRTDCDLIEVKPRIKRDIWVNVYNKTGDWATHDTREDADECASRNRIACVKLTIDCEEGEGL